MKKIFTHLCFLLLSTPLLFAQNDVTIDVSQNWVGYMNVFQLPANGGGYEFGSAWGIPDLKSSLNTAANTITLQPNFNTYANNPGDDYWINATTGEGNKMMDAVTFVEPGAGFNGSDLTFHGDVVSNTLDAGYTAKFFIKALDPNNGYLDALNETKVFDLPASGAFTVSATGAELATGLVIQYGFIINGPNANPADEATLGSVVVGNLTSSTKDLSKAATVSITPNPATERMTIFSESEVASFEVRNLSGQAILAGTDTTDVDVSVLSAGIYFVVVNLGDRSEVVKLVKN